MEEKEKGNKTRKEYSHLRRNFLTNTFYLTYLLPINVKINRRWKYGKLK